VIGLLHQGWGQEAVNIGGAYALEKGDFFVPSHRGKAIYYMRGISLKEVIAGIFGKKEGLGSGLTPAGSHMTGHEESGLLPTSGLIGSSIPTCVGVALGLKLQKFNRIVLNYFGDAACNRGDFHEALNFAAVFQLPIVFLCANNGYSLSTSIKDSTKISKISDRAKSYGFPGVHVDGRDVLTVYEAVSKAVLRCRKGKGPTLIEATVYREVGHSINDPDEYRSNDEKRLVKENPPTKRYESLLIEKGYLDEKKKIEIENKVKKEIEDAVKFAESCPEPEPVSIMSGVYG
jgi:TPP-dependent pyruvate/acetoin dehydrogenase alpha subunit